MHSLRLVRGCLLAVMITGAGSSRAQDRGWHMKVVDAAGLPVLRAKVTVYDALHGRFPANRGTDKSGVPVFFGMNTKAEDITISAPGYRTTHPRTGEDQPMGYFTIVLESLPGRRTKPSAPHVR